MADDAWGEFEADFFAAGDALGRRPAPEPDHPDEILEDEPVTPPVRSRHSLRTGALQALSAFNVWLAATLVAARHWLLWRGRLLQFWLAVTLHAGAEHALRAAAAYAFHPRLVKRRPWLLRATFAVLVSAVANYSAAAVLAASGAL